MTHVHQKSNIQKAFETFKYEGKFVCVTPYGNGHIHDTYRVIVEVENGRRVPYLLQRFNDKVFKDPVLVMSNIERVTTHLKKKMHSFGKIDTKQNPLTVIRTQNNSPLHYDEEGLFWRLFNFIDDSASFDVIRDNNIARAAARSFGEFLAFLNDLPEPPLMETIPDFHNTPSRFARLLEVVEMDPLGRVREVQAEIDFVFQREADTKKLFNQLEQGKLPLRVTHNDTKVNNVLFDNVTAEALCVIDLDTVMPGLAAYDFGELVRTCCTTAAEDEMDLSRVEFDIDVFRVIAEGFLDGASLCLTQAEYESLAFGGKLMTFENGMRFLTDYIEGDVYYKTHREGHNLDRSRNQFYLVTKIENKMPKLEEIIESLSIQS